MTLGFIRTHTSGLAMQACLATTATVSMLLLAGGMTCQTTTNGTTPVGNVGGPNILPSDHVMGDPNAAVTVVEYGDIQ
ncbi:MAG: hypothetical protein ACE5F9_12130 [Phycisphaerae bacterium]